jgi:hypothetical protein
LHARHKRVDFRCGRGRLPLFPRKVSLLPPNDIFGMITNFDVHFSALAVANSISRVITNYVTTINIRQNATVNLVGLVRFFQKLRPCARKPRNRRQRRVPAQPLICLLFEKHIRQLYPVDTGSGRIT